MKFNETHIIQRYSDGDVIISEGVVSNNAYIVLEGSVQIQKKVDNKNISIYSLYEGDVFGEMGLISETVRSANVLAVGNVTVGVIEKEMFEEMIEQLPTDARVLIHAIVKRLRLTTGQLAKVGMELEKTRSILTSFGTLE